MDLSKYYARICKEEILSTEGEKELFQEYFSKETAEKRKEAIKAKIISSALRFVFKQAKYHSKNDPTTFAELISAGNEGLLVAFEKYSLDRNVKFLTYAGFWVDQRILNAMAKMRIVSLPIQKQQLATRIQKARDSNPDLTLDQVKDLFEKDSDKHIEELFDVRYLTYYFDDMNGDSEEFSISPIEHDLISKLDNEIVWKTVADLDSPYREILAKLFGLEDGEEVTVSELAKLLHMPKKEIKRLRDEGLVMLRSSFTAPH